MRSGVRGLREQQDPGARPGTAEWPARRCRGPMPPRSPDRRPGPRSVPVSSAATSTARGSQACSAPHRCDSSRRAAIVSVADMRAPVRCTSIVNSRPIGPWPRITTMLAGLWIALHHGLETGVHRLHEAGALEGHAVGNLLHAALAQSSPSRARTARSRRPPVQNRP